MKRMALMLSVLAIFFVAVNTATARGWHCGPRHGYAYGYPGVVAVQPRVLFGPQIIVPPRPAWRRPMPRYRYRYYAPVPRYQFYYRGRGLSFGFGF